jgi:hypothetical protein
MRDMIAAIVAAALLSAVLVLVGNGVHVMADRGNHARPPARAAAALLDVPLSDLLARVTLRG